MKGSLAQPLCETVTCPVRVVPAAELVGGFTRSGCSGSMFCVALTALIEQILSAVVLCSLLSWPVQHVLVVSSAPRAHDNWDAKALTYAAVLLFSVFFLNVFIGVIGEQYARQKDRAQFSGVAWPVAALMAASG